MDRRSFFLVPLASFALSLTPGCASSTPRVDSASPAGDRANGGVSALSEQPAFSGLDCHVHMPPMEMPIAEQTPAALRALDEAGLSHGCLLSRGGRAAPGCEDRSCAAQRAFTEQQNDEVVARAKESKGRLLPFCSVPIMTTFSPEEITRCASIGTRGLKLHLFDERVSLVGSSAADAREKLSALLERATRHRHPVLIHVLMDDGDEVRAFFDLAAKQSSAFIIVAHQIAPKIAMLAEAPPNVWTEVSGLTHAPVDVGPFFAAAWRGFGIERVLFGSDWPYLSPARHVALLEKYPLSADEREHLIRTNPTRLFDWMDGRDANEPGVP